MPTDDVTGRPEELNSARLILDARLLRAQSRQLIQDSHLLIDRTWEIFARVLQRYLQPGSR